MIRHVAMFRWKAGVTAEHADHTAAVLRALPAAIPELVSYHVGRDLGISNGNFDFCVVAELHSVEAFEAYRDHPQHQAVLKEYIVPHIAERTAVQFSS